MLDSHRLSAIARYNESIAEKRFKKMGYVVERLDRHGPRKRPEFVVHESAGPILACEVKTKFSGGYLGSRDAHISTLDPALVNSGPFSWEIDYGPVFDSLANSIGKYRVLVEDEPRFIGLPFLVVFFFDEFADIFDFLPTKIENYPLVSGIAKIENDRAISEYCENLSYDDLEKIATSGSLEGLPQNSKEFRLMINTAAISPLPPYFVDSCIMEDRG